MIQDEEDLEEPPQESNSSSTIVSQKVSSKKLCVQLLGLVRSVDDQPPDSMVPGFMLSTLIDPISLPGQ